MRESLVFGGIHPYETDFIQGVYRGSDHYGATVNDPGYFDHEAVVISRSAAPGE